MQPPDDLNLSDACLLALRRYYPDWIPPLILEEDHRREKRIRRGNRNVTIKPMPGGLVLPRGVIWHKGNGRFWSRVWVGEAKVFIGTCGADQGEIDELGRRWAAVAAMRDAGASLDELHSLARGEEGA